MFVGQSTVVQLHPWRIYNIVWFQGPKFTGMGEKYMCARIYNGRPMYNPGGAGQLQSDDGASDDDDAERQTASNRVRLGLSHVGL